MGQGHRQQAAEGALQKLGIRSRAGLAAALEPQAAAAEPALAP